MRYLSFLFSRYLWTDAFLLAGPSAAFGKNINLKNKWGWIWIKRTEHCTRREGNGQGDKTCIFTVCPQKSCRVNKSKNHKKYLKNKFQYLFRTPTNHLLQAKKSTFPAFFYPSESLTENKSLGIILYKRNTKGKVLWE